MSPAFTDCVLELSDYQCPCVTTSHLENRFRSLISFWFPQIWPDFHFLQLFYNRLSNCNFLRISVHEFRSLFLIFCKFSFVKCEHLQQKKIFITTQKIYFFSLTKLILLFHNTNQFKTTNELSLWCIFFKLQKLTLVYIL